jgi:TPR repeat protein
VFTGCAFVGVLFLVSLVLFASATAPMDSTNASASQRDKTTTQHDPTDFAESFRLLRIKASQGDRDAEFQVGVMLRDGQGVEKDYEAAARWFRRAAMQQHPRAQFNLGLMLQQGQGVEKNISEALGLFRRAAHLNHPEAQFYLGDMLENGRGVARDREEAMRWYTLASQQGFAMATAALKKMRMQAKP